MVFKSLKKIGVALTFLFINLMSLNAFWTNRPCLNPISTVDWSFFFDEFLIGTYGYGDNKIPICQCIVDNGGGQPDIGIKMRIVDITGFAEVTDTPYYFPCFMENRPNKLSMKRRSSKFTHNSDEENNQGTYMNAHFISYPVFAVLNLFTNQACISESKVDLPFIGEMEPEWFNEFVAAYTHPENMLVSNPIAQVACLSDCVSSAFKKPNEALIWCRGCWHSQRAGDGRAEGKNGILDAAELSVNMLDFMAMSFRSAQSIPISKLPAGLNIHTPSANAIACGTRKYFPRIIKPAYFLQPAYPTSNSPVSIGYPPLIWTNFKTVPGHTSTVFATWKRKVCCFGVLHLLHVEKAE